MKIRFLKCFGVSVAATAAVGSAFGQVLPGTITFGANPPTTSVPTLSEWGMLFMALVLAILAFRAIRKANMSGTAMSALFAVTSAVMVVAGLGYTDRVLAGFGIDAQSGNQQNFPSTGDVGVWNSTSQDVYVLSIQASAGYVVSTPSATPACTVGMRIPANSSPAVCYVRVVGAGS